MTRCMNLVVGVVLAVGLVACGGGQRTASPASAGRADLLFVGTSHGIAAVHPTDGSVAYTVPGGVATPDWKVLYRSDPDNDGTNVSAVAPGDGSTSWTEHFAGNLVVKLATPGGTAIVLGPRYDSQGRAATELVVGRMGIEQPGFRHYHLDGNIEPEALSLDSSTLFLIQYLPAMHPTGYQLRQMNLATGHLGEVRRVDEDATGVMQGIARSHIMAPDGGRLYTLYTVAGHRAFVHVLDLHDKYAHCVDLPLPFGTGPQSAVALAMSPDASRLFVADRHSGATAVIDTTQLSIIGTETVAPAGSNGPASGVIGSNGDLYLASEKHLVQVAPLSLNLGAVTDLPARATALGATSGGLIVGFDKGQGLAVLDPESGRITARFRSATLDRITFIGAVAAAPLDEARQTIQCAC